MEFFLSKEQKEKMYLVLKMTDDWVSFTLLVVELLLLLCPRCWNSNNSRPCLVNLIIPRWSPAARCILHKVCQLASGLLCYLCRRNSPPQLKTKPITITRNPECWDRFMFPLNSSPKKASEGSSETFTVTTTYWCIPYSISFDERIDYFGMSGKNRSFHADGVRDKEKEKTGEDQAMSSSITEQRSPSSVPQTGRNERKRHRDGGRV